MVDKDHILQQLRHHFSTVGSIHIDDEGLVSVTGGVTLIKRVPQLPIQFDVVTGFFDCSRSGLTTLQGAPREVGKTFSCKINNLTTLSHGPQRVESYEAIGNRFINLDGLATEIPGYVQFNYYTHLPILRTLVSSKIWPHPDQVELEAILRPFAGTGKAGVIKCTVALIRAGYKENARW